MRSERSHVVTGAGRGIGRAIVERLLADGDAVVAIELDPTALDWLDGLERATAVVGDASDEAVTEQSLIMKNKDEKGDKPDRGERRRRDENEGAIGTAEIADDTAEAA